MLLSESYRIGQRDGRPTVSWEQIQQRADGLIVLAGGVNGAIGQAISSGNLAEAQAVAERWRRLVGDRFYIDLVRTGRAGENAYIVQAVEPGSTSSIFLSLRPTTCGF